MDVILPFTMQCEQQAQFLLSTKRVAFSCNAHILSTCAMRALHSL